MRTIKSLLRPTGAAGVARLLAAIAILGIVSGIAWVALSGGSSSQTLLDLTLEQLEDEVRRDPQNPQARLAIAIAYGARGFNKQAIEQFEEVLKVQEDNQTALIGMARVYLDDDEMDKALPHLLRVAELNEDNPFKHTLEELEAVYYDLGVIYIRKGMYDLAEEYLRQALEINTVDADALYMLGQTQEKNGNLEGALVSYQRAVRLAPDFVEVYRGMRDVYLDLGMVGEGKYATGMIYLAGRSYPEAIEDLTEATTAVPEMAEAHLGLGFALEAEGRPEEALASYRRAMELDATQMLADFGVQRLESR